MELSHYMCRIAPLLLAGVVFSCTPTSQEVSHVPIVTPSGLTYATVKEGSGSSVSHGDTITIDEWVRYSDSSLIFSTIQFGHPIQFIVGADQVIDGVDEGVRGMQPGEVRDLVIPPTLSERQTYPDNIHKDSTLYYTVALISVKESQR